MNSRNFETTIVTSQIGRRAILPLVFVDDRLGSAFPRIVTHESHCDWLPSFAPRAARRGQVGCKLSRAPLPFAVLVSAIGTIVHCAGINRQKRFALINQHLSTSSRVYRNSYRYFAWFIRSMQTSK